MEFLNLKVSVLEIFVFLLSDTGPAKEWILGWLQHFHIFGNAKKTDKMKLFRCFTLSL